MSNNQSSEQNRLFNQHIVILLNDLTNSNESNHCRESASSNLRQVFKIAKSKGVGFLTLIHSHTDKPAFPSWPSCVLDLYSKGKPSWLDIHYHCFGNEQQPRQQKNDQTSENLKCVAGPRRLCMTIISGHDGRGVIVNAVRHALKDVESGKIAADSISSDWIATHLEPEFLTDPDLIIITGGVKKLGNVMLWQCAYAELAFVEEPWQILTGSIFEEVLKEYGTRERRFGGLPGNNQKGNREAGEKLRRSTPEG